ncbi:ATP-grasp domain-containing protein [Pseudomonas sp. LB3P31]
MQTKTNKVFFQIGSTRDGLNPYQRIASELGYFTVLIETPDYIEYQSKTVKLLFDLIVPIERPENVEDIVQALDRANCIVIPKVVLAGFEVYNQSAFKLRGMWGSCRTDQHLLPFDKHSQRNLLAENCKVTQPSFHNFSSTSAILKARDNLDYPCIIKPVDGGGGLGVWMVENGDQLDSAVHQLNLTMNYGGRPFKGFIVETWLDGEEFSIQGVVYEGKPYALTYCQKLIERVVSQENIISFYESGHVGVTGSRMPQAYVDLMTACCDTFNYNRGAFHIDFIVVDNVPYFIEMGFRLSGMGVASLVKQASGVDWAGIAFGLEEGKGLQLPAIVNLEAVGQLRLRCLEQLGRAKLWVDKFGQGEVLTLGKTQPIKIALDSTLYADLTRHAGVLSVFKLASEDAFNIVSAFKDIVRVEHSTERGFQQCVG